MNILFNWPSEYYCVNRKPKLSLTVKFIIKCETARALGNALFWTCHNIYPHESSNSKALHYLVRKYLIARCKSVLFLTKKSHADAEAILGKINRWQVAAHGHFIGYYGNIIDKREARKTLKWNTEKTIYCYFGKRREYKNIGAMITCFASSCKTNEALHIYASGNERSDGFHHEDLQTENIHYHSGWMADEQLGLVLNAADAIVLPFKNILNSSTVIASLSYGKIVMVPECGSLAEIITDNNGIKYNPNDSGGLDGAFRRFRGLSKSAIKEIEKNALETAREMSWIKAAQSIKKILR